MQSWCSKRVNISVLSLIALSMTLPALAQPQTGEQTAQGSGAKSLDRPGIAPAAAVKSKTMDFSKPYGSHLQPILTKINANADQKVKITSIVQSYKSKLEPMRQEYRKCREEFLNCITTGSSAETVMQKQVELGHLSSDISSTYTLMRLEIRRLLKPEQVIQYEWYCRKQGWIR